MVKRWTNGRGPSYPKLDVNEVVAANYYPVNSIIAATDSHAGVELAVLTDVTQGGASLANGELELMVHRRLQHDDARGVQEPLNETMCGCNDIGAAPGSMGAHGHEGDGGCECAGLTVRGRHWIVFDTVDAVHEQRRQLTELLQFPATLTFADGKLSTEQPSYSAVAKQLPANVKLMTVTSNYADISGGDVMIRLAHLYSIGEHKTLSQPATVSLTDIFSKADLKVVSARAMSLTGNQGIEEMDANRIDWNTTDVTNGAVTAEITANGQPLTTRAKFDPKDPKLQVQLRPMEVRTFLVKLASKDVQVSVL